MSIPKVMCERSNLFLSDRIIVLEKGRVAEFDTPAALLAKKESLYYGLVKEAGLLDADKRNS